MFKINIRACLLVIIIFSLLFCFYLYNRIQENYLEEDPMILEIRNKLKPYFPEVNAVILLKGKKSYTINKKRVHLCLTDENGKYYDTNMLIYVTLHELAHVRCDEIGHTEKFHKIFNDMLKEATMYGVYDNRKPIIKDYCAYSSE